MQSAEAAEQSAAAQVKSIKAQIQQTESTLRGDEANLGYTKIYAPIAGTVVSQAAKQGQTLNANQQAPIVMRIADLSTMTVQAQVSEADVPKLRVGMDVYFTTLGGDNRRYYGKLRQIPPTPTVVNNVVLYDALFDVENPKQALMTQMTAQVFFVAAEREGRGAGAAAALAAARGRRRTASAARRKRRGRTGFRQRSAQPVRQRARAMLSVVGADGKAVDRDVKVGVMNRVSAEILSGLEAGRKGRDRNQGAGRRRARTRPAARWCPPATKGGGRP